MDIKGIVGICFGIFVILLIGSTGAFSEIIKRFTETFRLGYGFMLGLLFCLIIVFAILRRKK
ncbi:MAG: hypothetical protein ISS82_02930 [Nanoarchaeota archaeon]|nr:hypothetical protein [Nanoarchaeota archaeon]